MRSMTGWGRGEAEDKRFRVTVDVKTLNHRYLDQQIRIPFNSSFLEARLKEVSAKYLTRGKVEITVSIEEKEERTFKLKLNRSLVKDFLKDLESVREELGIGREVGFEVLDSLPWNRVFEIKEPELEREDIDVFVKALTGSLEGVVRMREVEGESIKKDLLKRVGALKSMVDSIGKLSEGLVELHSTKLRERMKELAGNAELDDARIVQEAALLADKSDVTEELNRLASHLGRLEKLINSSGGVGKKCDFLLQETYREINTIGSKMRGVDVSGLVVDVKAEIEKMREQIQNVE